MLVPVGVKYEDLQQTGRRAGDRKEIKVDIKEQDKQTQRHSAKALKPKQQVLEIFMKGKDNERAWGVLWEWEWGKGTP